MEFFETRAFTDALTKYLDDDGYRALQDALIENPLRGDLIPGTGGFRKMRWADPRRGKGTRGGLRVLYYLLINDEQIWFFTLYSKGELEDISALQRTAMKRAISEEIEAREAERDRKKRGGR